MSDHVEVLEELANSWDRDARDAGFDGSTNATELRAAIALMRGQSEPVAWKVSVGGTTVILTDDKQDAEREADFFGSVAIAKIIPLYEQERDDA